MKNKKKLVIIGATAFPEIIELIRDINKDNDKYEVLEILDDDESLWGSTIEGVKVAGQLEKVSHYSEEINFIFFQICVI